MAFFGFLRSKKIIEVKPKDLLVANEKAYLIDRFFNSKNSFSAILGDEQVYRDFHTKNSAVINYECKILYANYENLNSVDQIQKEINKLENENIELLITCLEECSDYLKDIDYYRTNLLISFLSHRLFLTEINQQLTENVKEYTNDETRNIITEYGCKYKPGGHTKESFDSGIFNFLFTKQLDNLIGDSLSKFDSKSLIDEEIKKLDNEYPQIVTKSIVRGGAYEFDFRYHLYIKKRGILNFKITKLELEDKRIERVRNETNFFKEYKSNYEKLEWVVNNTIHFKGLSVTELIAIEYTKADREEFRKLSEINRNEVEENLYQKYVSKAVNSAMLSLKLGETSQNIQEVIESYKLEQEELKYSEIFSEKLLEFKKLLNSESKPKNVILFISALEEFVITKILAEINKETTPRWISIILQEKIELQENFDQKYQNVFSSSIKGIHIEENLKVLQNLKILEELHLEFEPENSFDENAIKICFHQEKIGYVSANETDKVRKIINEENYICTLSYKSNNNGFITANYSIIY